MSSKEIIQKYQTLSNSKPMGIDLTEINHAKLFKEVQNNSKLKNKLERFGKIFKELEALKQLNASFYENNYKKILVVKNAIFYNELIQIQVFFEFIKKIDVPNKGFPNLEKIIKNRDNMKLNKIRNAISHFDWILKGEDIIFKGNNFEKKVSYKEVSEFCSLISIIAVFMTEDIQDE